MTSSLMIYTGAMTLGALHAFEPGHGKTLIAAYMIGSRGRAWDGIILGAIVTFTHTFSVILLGVAAKILSNTYSDTELHNWLGLVSAAIILGVGFWMLKQRLSGEHGHVHLFGKGHSHHGDHSHGDHSHAHTEEHSHTHGADAVPVQPVVYSKLNLLLLGISGGIIPCPAAITTLLVAVAAGKIAQGLTITLFFSLGLGLVMMAIGLLLSQADRLTRKIGENMQLAGRMGIVSALLIIFLGSYTMFNSVKSIWFV